MLREEADLTSISAAAQPREFCGGVRSTLGLHSSDEFH